VAGCGIINGEEHSEKLIYAKSSFDEGIFKR
jgi:hypothetical protein